jgi:hypothetical protein
MNMGGGMKKENDEEDSTRTDSQNQKKRVQSASSRFLRQHKNSIRNAQNIKKDDPWKKPTFIKIVSAEPKFEK